MGSQVPLVNGDSTASSLPHYNNPSKTWVVQKFGGTSVGKSADKIAEDIVRCGSKTIFQCMCAQKLIANCG